VSQDDIQTLFGILNENLHEGVTEKNDLISVSGGMLSLFYYISDFLGSVDSYCRRTSQFSIVLQLFLGGLCA